MGYIIATAAIIIEFGLLAIVMLLTLLFKWHLYYSESESKNLRVVVMHFLIQLITTETQFRQNDFKNSWRHLENILPALLEVDNAYDRSRWQDRRLEFIKVIILPLK